MKLFMLYLPQGDPVGISWRCLDADDLATAWWKHYDNMLSRFHRIPERNGRTDIQTDRQNCYINIARQCA